MSQTMLIDRGLWLISCVLNASVRLLLILGCLAAVAHVQPTFAQFNAVAVSPEGKLVAAGGEQGRIYLWEVASGKRLHEVKTKHPCTSLKGSVLEL